jgi:hypothetical protein
MRWERRSEWGATAPSARRTDVSGADGVLLHYPGDGTLGRRPHRDHEAALRSWQAMHMARGSNDIEYSLAVCACDGGTILECRSERDRPKIRPGCNGSEETNFAYFGVTGCWALGDGPPPRELLEAYAAAVRFLRAEAGAGDRIGAHRDVHPTACPGDFIVAELGTVRRLADDPEGRLRSRRLRSARAATVEVDVPADDIWNFKIASKTHDEEREFSAAWYLAKIHEKLVSIEDRLAALEADGDGDPGPAPTPEEDAARRRREGEPDG